MSITREGRRCSFCATPGGPGTDVPLVGGLGAQVCASCIDEFHGIVHDDEQIEGARRTMPWESMSDAEVLATLPLIIASAEQSALFASEWVSMLRERSVSWAEIGRTLGVSRQAAWERFAKKATGDGKTASHFRASSRYS